MSALTLVIGNKNYSSWSLRPWLAMKMAGVAFEELVNPLRQDATAQDCERLLAVEKNRAVRSQNDACRCCARA